MPKKGRTQASTKKQREYMLDEETKKRLQEECNTINPRSIYRKLKGTKDRKEGPKYVISWNLHRSKEKEVLRSDSLEH
jgi:hypothetical protein